ncbi:MULTISPECIES: class II fructose-bisphosphatase [Acetobacter]|jgi:fructose-1,6-bisphosphatase II / sedoheptulose-1,7-bisphosphatase|uniref:Fructose-1,6-bisphosphatase n=1 Tax=Acetobacter lovaniensis TaxID=104100 RepID=A0A841QDH3_9PROT|nr:class II fructose-bisphosphatase [Acetobacter lovaniensis]MBB6456283.1 fructose-1,6-bisphosphatase II / sedoheptulose-1,7-bisphosphatase [Acetobacter lovaniensis]MCI1697984.1 class II fructose-bisphosphatase [Acetobacter lovaniensis]MCI1795067.1 class II fructose-bisphosphatase [Acetobacter lovaniensis]MCP1239113.1 class II fructose-bisphosphatase [Acetobacter lovaniensis]NHN80657.1 class II fructose-bisphosphatase [Acetobacter lovaniensis]
MSDSIGPSPFVVSDRNLALELVRVTEAAALASARWTGRGRKNDADGAAVEAMRIAFDTVAIDGTVVIGEGEMDEAPMLYIGEKVGSGGPAMDIAVDPLEGTNLCAKDMPNAITVVALAERGNFLHAPDVYMDKIVVGPNLPAGVVDLENTIETNLKNLAKARGKSVQDLLLCTLDRERHEEMIARARAAGARVRLLSDGDVAGGIAACLDSSQVDIYVGSGGAPEGVLTAAAVRCVEGQMQGRLLFEDDAQRERAQKMNPGKNPDRKLDLHDMAAGSVLFSATGVTTGALLRGVRQYPHQAVTHSLVMRSKSGTSRFIEGHHNFKTKTWTPQ